MENSLVESKTVRICIRDTREAISLAENRFDETGSNVEAAVSISSSRCERFEIALGLEIGATSCRRRAALYICTEILFEKKQWTNFLLRVRCGNRCEIKSEFMFFRAKGGLNPNKDRKTTNR